MITCNNTQCKHCIDNTCTHHNIKISDMGTCLTYQPDTYIGKCTSCKNFCTVKYNDNKIYRQHCKLGNMPNNYTNNDCWERN